MIDAEDYKVVFRESDLMWVRATSNGIGQVYIDSVLMLLGLYETRDIITLQITKPDRYTE